MSAAAIHTFRPPTIVPVALDTADELAGLEAVDTVIVSDTCEQIDIGGAGPLADVYLRLTSPDPLVTLDGLRRLIDRAEAAVLDARQDRADAERHECPGCPVLLEPDEDTCGSARCDQVLALDMAGLIP